MTNRSKEITLLLLGCFGAGMAGNMKWGSGAHSDAEQTAAIRDRAPNEHSQPATSSTRQRTGPTEQAKLTEEQQEKRDRDLRDRVRRLVRAAMEWDDIAQRDEALATVIRKIGDSDAETAMEGLTAYLSIFDVDWEEAGFETELFVAIRRHLESPVAELRNAAWDAALKNRKSAFGGAEYLDRVVLAQGLNESIASFNFSYVHGYDFTGQSGEVVRTLLKRGEDPEMKETLLRELSGQYSPELEQDLIRLRLDPEMGEAAFDALRRQKNRSPSSVAVLLDAYIDPATSEYSREDLGRDLNNSIPENRHGEVAEIAARLILSRVPDRSKSAWPLLESYAGPDQLPLLRAVAAKPNLSPDQRSQIQVIISRAEGRNIPPPSEANE